MNTLELRSERKKRGLTSQDMANMLGLKFADTYSKKERGIRHFNPGQIIAIAKALKLNATQVNVIFFDGELPYGNRKKPVNHCIHDTRM